MRPKLIVFVSLFLRVNVRILTPSLNSVKESKPLASMNWSGPKAYVVVVVGVITCTPQSPKKLGLSVRPISSIHSFPVSSPVGFGNISLSFTSVHASGGTVGGGSVGNTKTVDNLLLDPSVGL